MSIEDGGSDCVATGKLAPGNLGLLQQYRHLASFTAVHKNFDRIGGTADIDWPPAPIASEAYDLVAAATTQSTRLNRVSRHGRFPLERRQLCRGQGACGGTKGRCSTSGTRSVTCDEPGRWRGPEFD